MRNRVVAVATAAVVAGLVGGVGAPARAEASGGGSDRAAVRCAGQTVDTAAKIRYRTETTIDAPLRTIWRIQTDVHRWPSWQEPVLSSKRLDRGPLRPGSSFRWTTSVPETALNPATTLVVTSTVRQLQHQRCLRWDGPAIGAGLRIDEGVHVWTFTEVDGRVLVRTEETWRGEQVEQDVAFSTTALGEGLKTWLTELKTLAEQECETDRR
ncbi:SRPBCC family protein [Micromonospora chokoriensis]|uniref:Polyketide cyclase / dehydrase and lipid transport n=1 Tax=Micromonospora chokoriensis TaxID=356851 RepID=A0A1C4XCF6_9ACTN|nr:SRPBCC family protein [Micromonospora chokoriensis]SCF05931.1 Polyketide cyclase / dehydrase and lipid transport [Micromonospora chokoriensis]